MMCQRQQPPQPRAAGSAPQLGLRQSLRDPHAAADGSLFTGDLAFASTHRHASAPQRGGCPAAFLHAACGAVIGGGLLQGPVQAGVLGPVRVSATSESIFTDAAKVDSDAAKVDLDSVRVRQKRGLPPNHLDKKVIFCPPNAQENHRKGADVGQRAAATPQGPDYPFQSRPRPPAPLFLKCRRSASQPGPLSKSHRLCFLAAKPLSLPPPLRNQEQRTTNQKLLCQHLQPDADAECDQQAG